MTASLENPVYTVYVIDGKTKYNISPAVIDISLSNQEKQVAQCATINIQNAKFKDKSLSSILKVRLRVMIYANDGTTKAEVFRGWIWTKYHQAEIDTKTITLKCYDNLIYLQESEDSLYFSKGKNTKSVMSTICNKWGITLNYSYSTITHPKLVLRGTLTDIFMSDILDPVKERTGNKYVITSQKDVMYVKPVGSNKKVYKIEKKNNAIGTRVEQTMDGMVTKVVILGKAEEKTDKMPVVATVTGNTSTYGTLQKLIDKDTDASLAEAKKEAQNIINEQGKPTKVYQVKTTDIPWIQKGDLVHVTAGGIDADLIAVSIERDISNEAKSMTLTLSKE